MFDELTIIKGYAITDYFEKDLAMFLALTIKYGEYYPEELPDTIYKLNPFIEKEVWRNKEGSGNETNKIIAGYLLTYFFNGKADINSFTEKLFNTFPIIKEYYDEYPD